MKQSKLLFAVLFVFSMMNLSLFAQVPISSTLPAVGILGANDFVTNTNYTSPTISTLAEPAGVVVDPLTGKLFVADRDNRRVLRFSSAAKLINGSSAEAVFGQPNYTTRSANTGGISASTMNNPNAVYMDANGCLWVADRDNHRVLRFDNASTKASSSPADGVLGQPDFTTNSSGVTASKMYAPAGVFADMGGRIWVTDRANNRVLRFDGAAAKPNGSAADAVLGQIDFTTGTSGTTATTMSAPWGLFLDGNGRLWVADRGNSRVLRFDSALVKPNGSAADGVLGQTSFTTSTYAKTQAGLGEPRGVAVDANGRLYVADEGNTRIMVYEGAASLANGANANYVLGQPDFTSDNAPNPPTATSLCYPLSLFIDNATNQVWVPDLGNHRVLRFDIGPPAAIGVLGTSNFVTSTNYTSPSVSTFAEPAGVTVDITTGKLFVADRDNRRVLRFSSAAKYINGSDAEAVFGQPNFVTRSANTGGISASTMNNPNSVYMDGNGRLWVADRDNHRVLRFDNAATKLSSSAADGVLGQPDFVTNSSGATPNKLYAPACVFADMDGRVWVADRANNRVLRFDAAATKANGASANAVLGQADLHTGTSGTTETTMSAPWGVYLDGHGKLWVADRGNSRVLRFDNAASKANGAAADGVLGQTTFTTSVYTKTQSGLGEPRGVAVDAAGRLFVADEGNTRIMVYDNAGSLANGANANYVMGQADFVSDNSANPPTATSLSYPLSLFIDYAANQIWVPDAYNHRVLRFAGFPVTVTAPAAPQNLIAVGSNSQVTLKWNKNSDANFFQYRIYGGTTSNPSSQIDFTTGGISDTMKVISGLTNGTYYFRVTAVSLSLLESGYSNEVSATPFSTVSKDIAVVAGWNILSAPMNSTNPLTTGVFSGANSPAYGYNNGYVPFDTLLVGKGFWIRYANATTVSMTGTPTAVNTIPLFAGWNLIGGQMANLTVANIATTPVGIINSLFYGFSNAYTSTTTLVSGAGYWVRASAAGTMNTDAVAKNGVISLPSIEKDWAKIIITDRTGKSSTLYAAKKGVNLNSFELPPMPPAGIFDVRFSTQRSVEILGTESKSIALSSVDYPVEIRVEGIALRVMDKATNGKIVNSVLKSGNSVSISNSGVSAIEIASIDKPTSFELSQNYPNPFNPATTIKFALPENANVSLTVYNQIGEKVADLINGPMESGFHSILWNAENLASGVYFYQIKAGTFTSVKKLVLMK